MVTCTFKNILDSNVKACPTQQPNVTEAGTVLPHIMADTDYFMRDTKIIIQETTGI